MLSVFFMIASAAVIAEEAAPEAVPMSAEKLQSNVSYFFGYAFGNNLIQGGNETIDFDLMKQGMEAALDGKEPNLTKAEQDAVIAEIQARQKKMQDLAQQQGLGVAAQYLAESAKREGVSVTQSGLQYEVLVAGTGKKPAATDTVKVHYAGSLINGQEFDSSIKRGEPVEFKLNQVIPGWTEGVQLMAEGAKYKFTIPPSLGYGPGGTRGIPPNSVLIFEVELIEVKAAE